jgi:hypothetical protein
MKRYFFSGYQWDVRTGPDATFKSSSFPMIGDTHTNRYSITTYLRQGITASGQLDDLFHPASSRIVGKRSFACKASGAPRVADMRA